MDVVSGEEDLLEQVNRRQMLQKVCQAVDATLTEQEREVILHRYGLGGYSPKRQREVAQQIGISRSYVSRIEKRALEKLRQVLEA